MFTVTCWLLSVAMFGTAVATSIASAGSGSNQSTPSTTTSPLSTDEEAASQTPTPSPSPEASVTPSSVSAGPTAEPPIGREEQLIGAAASHDFFDGSLLVGVESVYDSWSWLNISTEVDACPPGAMEVGERALLEGEIDGVRSWFRVTLVEVAPHTTIKIRVERLAPGREGSRSCP
jgi:hypothetical protein